MSLHNDRPAFEDITNAIVRGRVPRWDVHAFGFRVLLVNPSASDSKLRSDFNKWLTQQGSARKSEFNKWLMPQGLARKGRGRGVRGIRSSITKTQIESWRRYEVLAVFDLDFHSEIFGTQELTHEALCDLINPRYTGNAKEWGISAREKLREALKYADLLAA